MDSDGTTKRRNLLEAATYAVQKFQEYGFDIHKDSRFATMQRILSKGYISPDHQDFSIAVEATRDARMMEFVFEQLAGVLPDQELIPKLKLVIKDSTLPEHDLQESIGRNTQCELYTAAICQKAGLCPSFMEPDVRCSFNGLQYGIAVKRVKSEQQIEKHIRKAAKQIDLSGHIAMDVSVAYNRENEPLMNVSDERLRKAFHAARTRFADDYYQNIVKWVNERDVRSIILLDHFVRQHPQDGWGFDSLTYFIPLLRDNQPRSRQFEQFQKRFLSGLATPAI